MTAPVPHAHPTQRLMTRRRLLHAGMMAGASSSLLAGRALAEGPARSPQNITFRLVLPGVFRDGPPLSFTLSGREVYQGGALQVRANYRPPATAILLGRHYTLSDEVVGSVGFVSVATGDPAGPANVTVQITKPDGEPEYSTIPITILATDWTVDYITLPPGSGDILDNPDLIVAEVQHLARVYSGVVPKLWVGRFISPAPTAPISGYFGEQRSFNGGPVGGHHGGTDFGVTEGTPIIATNRGVVVLAEKLYVRGNMVIIDHGGGVFSGYAHLSKIAVTAGQPIGKGEYLGDSGATGFVAGAHLHWEMSVGGVLVDGLRWLDLSQGF